MLLLLLHCGCGARSGAYALLPWKFRSRSSSTHRGEKQWGKNPELSQLRAAQSELQQPPS